MLSTGWNLSQSYQPRQKFSALWLRSGQHYPEYDDVEEMTTQLMREKTAEFEALLAIFSILQDEVNFTRRHFHFI